MNGYRGWVCIILVTLAMINVADWMPLSVEAQLVAAMLPLMGAFAALAATRRAMRRG